MCALYDFIIFFRQHQTISKFGLTWDSSSEKLLAMR